MVIITYIYIFPHVFIHICLYKYALKYRMLLGRLIRFEYVTFFCIAHILYISRGVETKSSANGEMLKHIYTCVCMLSPITL